ncbi:FtsK/SpoIIIE domain-containing protein [Sphingomonas panni]|uniref:FtsK/SpoIIIE domain-containing protein n=1 Tax=Sphingomonas panni TaxID=237612 RepID=UPI001F5B9F8D|nr:FtsK/SpoIIIE domain-containing protein [Sphingomonas panni]
MLRTLDEGSGDAGFARFLVSALSDDEVLSIVDAVRSEPELSGRMEIKLPRYRFADAGVDASLLTDLNVTVLRHERCEREGRLMVLTDESQRQSLSQLVRVDADALLDQSLVRDWIAQSNVGADLDEMLVRQFEAAFRAVIQIDRVPLRRFSQYVVDVTEKAAAGATPARALGSSLMALRIPRYDDLFEEILPQRRHQTSQWKQRYASHWRRASYLAKRDLQQLPIARSRLRERLDEKKADMRDEVVAALEAYVDAQDGVSEASIAPFDHDWTELRSFFEEAGRPERESLGKRTLAFYSQREPDLLTQDELAYVRNFAQHRSVKPERGPEDEAFFASHGREMRSEDPRLAALWERFVFGQRVECDDLVDGIVQCVRRLYEPSASGRRKLVVEGVEATPASFLGLNDEVGRYFATAYRGLKPAFDGVVEFRRLEAFRYPEIANDIEDWSRRNKTSTARKARQLSFKVWLQDDEAGEGQKSVELLLVWEASLAAVGMGLTTDLSRLRTNRRGTPLVRCMAGRRAGIGRGRSGEVDLLDMGTLEPTASRDRGSFVPAASRCESLASAWRDDLAWLIGSQLVAAPTSVRIRELFRDFEDAYRRALEDVQVVGWHAVSIADQATAYGELLSYALSASDSPEALERLQRPLLEIGVAQVEQVPGHEPAAVLCPWHPLRLAASRARWLRCRDLIAPLFAGGLVTFTDNGALFFNELRRDLSGPVGVEVVPAWLGEKVVVLSTVSSHGGYSLHETPVAIFGGGGATSDDVRAEARQVAEVVTQYLRLQPHERDNLSIVLYNCDAATLPRAVVECIRSTASEDGEAMCQVTLRHTDEARLREVYQQLSVGDSGDDVSHGSEATRDFMSRLRISIMVTQGPTSASDGPPFDIVFCHDVISRQARLAWTETERREMPYDEIMSAHWPRRIPVRPGERDAIVLLACPVQPREGWAHLASMAALVDADMGRAPSSRPRVPARMTDVRSARTKLVLDETHRLGQWVVNVDDLLDRRQLLDSGVSVIRHRRAGSGGRSMIVSSAASDTLLRETLKARLRHIDPTFAEEELRALAGKLIHDANLTSGDLVLRAARRGANAGELIGVVLSRFLVETELGADRRSSWLFLDDYAAWLGQDERKMADLLCLSPRFGPDGRPFLDVVVTEAKFVAAAGMSSKSAESARQLRDTLQRLESALSPDSPPADRRIWRARLAEMLMDGLRGQPSQDLSGVDWAAVLREEDGCGIRVRGYSHVFGHGGPDDVAGAADLFVGVKDTGGGQERYAPDSLREIIRAYAAGGDATAVRMRVRGGLAFEPDPDDGSGPTNPREEDVEAVAAEVSTGDPAGDPRAEADEPAALLGPPASTDGEPRNGPSRFRTLLETYADAQQAQAAPDGWLDEVAGRCRNALLRYGLSANLVGSVLTPNSALLRFQGSDKLTVAKVENRIVELKTTHGLEVLNVLAQPGLVVIVIRRPDRARVLLAGAWKDWRPEPDLANNRLMIAVREDDGAPLFLEPQPAPHTLVAGSTGSGKSVLVQNIILGIAATNTPLQAKLILIDPKAGVDYFAFEDLPHLDGGIIDQPDVALDRLRELVVEMDRRYQLFRTMRTSNLTGYNSRADDPLPTIWLVHDEFADWMQIDSYRAEVETAVSRLGVKARAAGIYLIFAAQRPDNTVFPMQLRSNLGNRLVLRVDSAGTSDLSLGVKGGGAERLLGQGHMVALTGGDASPQFAQVPYIDEMELAELVKAIAEDSRIGGDA